MPTFTIYVYHAQIKEGLLFIDGYVGEQGKQTGEERVRQNEEVGRNDQEQSELFLVFS